ncbi:hypothetical protein [Microbulbifer rhizosphaerae]|uniref:Tetratricopeptide repeat-containing protein n=1 Tax=Microbulbifer rhizosphaerae TaxID=1562603 RepID=A0A7W4Z849_9GAMM|nr:hypothetical protein [Microbulbifer rhizosphaerae]MBB3060176.1 hypothetical protein [Microbulbifer rhizosphaerae]
MPSRSALLLWLLLLPLLPACSLIPTQQQALEGFPPNALQQVRRQSTELDRLQKLDIATSVQQQQIKQLHSSLRQFERDVIRAASRLEQQDDWRGADGIFRHASHALPDSRILSSARQKLAERRQLREELVRTELAIHRGERLLKDAEAYQRLRQVKGPGPLTWLELNSYHRKCRKSAKELQLYAQRALERRDYALARRGLQIAQRLYGDDDKQDDIERDLALADRQLRQAKRQPAKASFDNGAVVALQQALDAGDLLSARQHLNRLRQRSPRHPQLLPLQSQFRTQLNVRIKTAIKRGNDLYSQGDIDRALDVWREAKTLDPDNVELLASIARAEKVLQNLRALSASPTAEF